MSPNTLTEEYQIIYDKAYETEQILIDANSRINTHERDLEKGIRFQYKVLNQVKFELNNYILRKSAEILAREKALSDALIEKRYEDYKKESSSLTSPTFKT